MNIETLTERVKEVWVGDLIEAAFGTHPEQVFHWAGRCLLRLCTLTLVFGLPWVLLLVPVLGTGWTAAMGAAITATLLSIRCRWSARSQTLLGYALFLLVSCSLLIGWSSVHASTWQTAAGGLLIAAGGCRAMAVAQRQEL